ncbi:unnamed protein product [Rhizopus stolonifer]
MFSIKKSFMHGVIRPNSTVRRCCIPKRPMINTQRPISIWTIPKIVLATTSKKNRRLALGAFGALSVLSSMLGPVVWVAVGGIGSLFGWRLFKKAKSWWNYLAPPPLDSSATQWFLSKIGTHTATEKVREESIKKLSNYFEGEGKRMLEDFGLDHKKELVWEDVYKSETTRLDKNGNYQVLIKFWLSDEMSKGPQGGSCQVTSSGIVNGNGHIELDSVKIDAPGWHKEEIIPV